MCFGDVGSILAPGGPSLVGERGPEIVNLSRGAQVVPNHRLTAANGYSRSVNHRHEYNIVVSGNADKELMERLNVAGPNRPCSYREFPPQRT